MNHATTPRSHGALEQSGKRGGGNHRLVKQLLLLAGLLLGAVSQVQAGEFCSTINGGLIDGNDPLVRAELATLTQITIDTDCTFKNFPITDPLTVTINFQTNDPSIYLIVFDNVYFIGNMACANVDHKLWFVNGADYGSNNTCQDLFIPVESIAKQAPATTATIGEPFTYTLTIPVMYDVATATWYMNPSPNTIGNVRICDDLTALTGRYGTATGADLSYVSNNAYLITGATTTSLGPLNLSAADAFCPDASTAPGTQVVYFTDTDNPAFLASIDGSTDVPPGSQLVIEMQVVANDVVANAAGNTFINTAAWQFSRSIDLDDNGIIEWASDTNGDGIYDTGNDLDGDGKFENEFFDPLPGESGVSELMTIAEPDLIVTKSSSTPTLNTGVMATFTVNVHNEGGATAWGTSIVDQFPAGMCDYDPTTFPPGVMIGVYDVAGTTLLRQLWNGIDYDLSWNGDPTCTLTIDFRETANAALAPTEQLIITYQSQLDGDVADASTHENVAVATQWFSSVSSNTGRRTYGPYDYTTATGAESYADNEIITATLSGYFFKKSVMNVTTGEYPATSALPGDVLRYTLELENFNVPSLDSVTITDDLGVLNSLGDIVAGSLTYVDRSFPVGHSYTFNPAAGTDGAGYVEVTNFDLGSNQSYYIQFEVTVGAPANGTVISDQATITGTEHDTLITINGVSDDPFDAAGPARLGDATATFNPTDVTVITPGSLSKTNGQTTARVGEQFTYTILVPASPVNTPLYDVVIEDVLPDATTAELGFVSAQVISGGSWVLSKADTATGFTLQDNITGIDIPANSRAEIEVTVELLNSSINQAGVTFSNTASYQYNRINGVFTSQQGGGSAVSTTDMTVLEPQITTISKSADNLTPTAGDIVRYSVALSAASGATVSDIFDVILTDTLDLGLVYQGNPTVTPGGGVGADNTISDPAISGDGSTTPQTLLWSLNNGTADIDIAEGETITIAYDVRVLDSVLGGTALSNSAVAQWSSLDGASASERDGSDGIGGLNDYITDPAIETVTTPAINATISKSRITDTFGAGDTDVRIGDIVEYELRVTAPEGTLGNLELVDTLPQGLQFEGVVSINTDTTAPYSAVAPFTHADIAAGDIVEAGDATLGATTVTWSLGDLTNQPNDGLNDDFVILYRARVLNNVIAHTALTTTLGNSVSMSYDTASGTLTQSSSASITALQPQLSVTKTAAPAGGDNIVDAGELITYTVEIQNSGLAPAYDVVLEDLLPVGLDATTLATSSINLLSGPPPLGTFAPTYTAATRTASWNFDSGTADEYTIPAGDTLQIVYTVNVDAAVAQGLTLTNAASVESYYSFDDEAVPTLGTVATTREQYGPITPPATSTLYTGAPPSKALLSAAEATIGEEVVYQITVPGTASSAPLYDVQITDALEANLELLSATVTGVAGAVNSSTASQMNIAVPSIPAGQQAVIELRTRVRNVLSAQQSLDINNTVSYTYAYTSGGTTQPALASSDIVTVNIVEPTISNITKSANNLAPTAGDVVRYSVVLTAASGVDSSDVFDVSLTDTLSLGLVYEGNPTVTVGGGVGADNSISAPTISGDGVNTAQTLVWSLNNSNADIDIAEGETITIAYDVRVLDSVLGGTALSNSAVAAWTSLDGASSFERDGSDGIGGLNDYITAPVSVSSTSPAINATFSKSRTTDTFGAGDTDVRIGDIVEYELRLTVPEGTLGNLVLVDTLPQGLQFEGVASINGDTIAPYSAVSPFTHTDITAANIVEAGNAALGQTTVTWSLGDVTNQPNDGLDDDFVILYRARVLDNVFAHTSLSNTLSNTVSMSYDTAGGTVTQSSSASIAALQPQLSVSKTATPAGGDTVVDAGELITYTVNITNSGLAPAYDTVLQDVLPAGLDATTLATSSITLDGAPLATFAPSYVAATRTATWNLDRGGADTYTIPAGSTLSIEYTVNVDAAIGPGLTLSNVATATLYYSFDDEAVPALGTVSGTREQYGPSNTSTTTLTTALPVALLKETTQATATVGEQFSYRITVPSTPQTTALNDVRILDDLNTSAADLRFVSVTKIAGSQPWTPVNTGDVKNLVIADTTNGIDIPAGEQAVIEITVVLEDTATNVSGLLFNNSADYTYNAIDNDGLTQAAGLPGSSGNMTIAEPDSVTLEKGGPVTMRRGLAETFTLNVQNTGTSTAWDLTIVDQLPDPTPGGMCNTPPSNITARIYQSNATTPVSGVLVQGSDYVTSFSGAPGCTLTLTMQSAAAAIAPTQRLIVSYDALLDDDSVGGTTLTNIAAATEWFSQDTAGSGATGETRRYTGTLSDGTVGTLDEQDAHSLTTESPVLIFRKSVENVTSGANPGSTAEPGDTLRYTLYVENISDVDLPSFSIVDELDALNASAMFEPGTLTIVSAPPGAVTSGTDASGGSKGSGLLDVSGLSLAAAPVGGPNPNLSVTFEVRLAAVIDSGTVVLNQAGLASYGVAIGDSDDPNVNGTDDPNISGDEDATQTVITSAPAFEVWKSSEDISGDPAELVAGDTLRYTITVKNVGNENAVNTVLQDQVPANTTYVAGSTTLNGNAVADTASGIFPLQGGLLINAPEDTTAGAMRADSSATTANVATITFDVVINNNVINGAVIANQAFVNGEGAGNSGAFPEEPSDDPATATLDDPTRDVVGNLPLLDAQKTVQLIDFNPAGTAGVVDPGDRLSYTITITNLGPIPASGVSLLDAVPADTTYVANSVSLNGAAVGDIAGASPLAGGMAVNSPSGAAGEIAAGGSAVVTLVVEVNGTTAVGTIISNQGVVSSNELPAEPTDADGIDSNGDQPTEVIVGNVPLLSITKEVRVVGGGSALAGEQLEYVIRVENISTLPATDVVITDNLDLPVAGQLHYFANSATLNGSSAGVNFASPLLTANYGATYGDLLSGETAVLRFRATIDSALSVGTTITNTAQVGWNAASQNASASVSIDVGATPGFAQLNGQAWLDANNDQVADSGEPVLAGWSVEIYRNDTLLDTVQTDANGMYQISGLAANDTTTDQYSLQFVAPWSGSNSAMLGSADSPYTDGLQSITQISVGSGTINQGLNLPILPNGVVYDSIQRIPTPGTTLTMLDAASQQPLPSSCFDDPQQQNQLTPADGYYRFDINFSDPACPAGGSYLIEVTPPATAFEPGASQLIPAQTDATTAAFSVPACLGSSDDAVPATADICEAVTLATAPPTTVAARSAGTNYYLHLQLDDNLIPGESQLFNNHIPLDPVLDGAVTITKTSALVNVSRGDLVPYTITIHNTYLAPLQDLSIVDTFPPGFKYVEGSARLDGQAVEPRMTTRQLFWENLTLDFDEKRTLQLLMVVGSGVSEADYINRAQIVSTLTGNAVSGEATATVRVVPDPTFDCTDIIGKVFDDKNLNGYQDEGEGGLPGARVVSARGLIVTSDEHGRFHITCAMVPNEVRGSNFILKLDDRSLPSGYRVTSENPRVVRLTRGKMAKFNFGATIHHVVRLDVADGVFEPGTTTMRQQWRSRVGLLLAELQKAPAVLRISYLADVEKEGLVDDRIDALKEMIQSEWEALDCCYRLTIESEIFWRRGAPPERSGVID